MKPVLFADEMKRIDSYTIHSIGLEGCVLMERAALFVVEIIQKHLQKNHIQNPHIAIVCGNGNNGGDGYALARILSEEGYRLSIVAPFTVEKKSVDNEKQLQILRELGLSVNPTFEKEEYDIIVDGLFGIGLNRPLEGAYREIVEKVNGLKGYKIAIDIPSGLHSDTGIVMGCCMKADCTVTMQYEKMGLYVGDGKEFTGKIYCKNIGIHDDGIAYRMKAYDEPVKDLLPHRAANGNKGTFGKVLIIAGDKDMAGACVLCAKAAYRSGCGMVKIISKPENREIIQKMLPEAMLCTMEYDDSTHYPQVLESIHWADSLVIGPGMGRNDKALDLLQFCIKEAFIPMVLDADALWLISKYPETKNLFAGKQAIFTPHVGEFAMLTGRTVSEIKKNLCQHALEYSEANDETLVLKDAATIISEKEQSYQIVNTVGNDGMATAGSGDVLAGIIGSLLAKGMETFQAASVGAYWHGVAGDIAASKLGKNALMANDIIEALNEAENGFLNGEWND